MIDLEPRALAVVGGLAVGAVLGATLQRTGYCMMGAVADYALSGRLGRLRAWMLAIAVAVVGCQALHLAGAVDLSHSVYRSTTLPWLSLPLGGVLFGFGMVIACGCASRSLVNFASGDLRALVALLFMGVAGYATMRGLLALPQLWLKQAFAVDVAALGLAGQGLPEIVAGSGPAGFAATTLAALLVASALLAFVAADPGFWRERAYVVAAVVVGGCVAAGWWVTGVLAADEFEPAEPTSLRFVAPVAESLQYLMTWTGSRADFGVASVGGVVAGAFTSAAWRGELELRAFEDRYDLVRYMAGGALMGVGGVLAMGCTVGQGLTGVATLSVGSFLALAGILGGGLLGVRYLEQGSLRAAMRATLGGV